MGKINYSRLEELIKEYKSIPFKWGVHDCAKFASMVISECSGVDALNGLEWSSKKEALELIRGGFEKRIDETTGWTKIGPYFATLLDICLVENEGRQAIGVCTGSQIIVPTKFGLEFLPITESIAAWRNPVNE